MIKDVSAFFLLVVLALSVGGLAQNPPAPSPDTANPQSKDKNKKKDKPAQNPLDAEEFSEAVAQNLMGDLREGLEGHSSRLMLSAFDGDKMNGFLQFQDQIRAMFDNYSTFTVHFRIAQSTVEGPRGVVLVDFQMEETPTGDNASPVRKNAQVRIEMERGSRGWRIVEIDPRNFFS